MPEQHIVRGLHAPSSAQETWHLNKNALYQWDKPNTQLRYQTVPNQPGDFTMQREENDVLSLLSIL